MGIKEGKERTTNVSRRDEELLAMIGMTPEQAEKDATRAEDETIPDPLTGYVHHAADERLTAYDPADGIYDLEAEDDDDELAELARARMAEDDGTRLSMDDVFGPDYTPIDDGPKTEIE